MKPIFLIVVSLLMLWPRYSAAYRKSSSSSSSTLWAKHRRQLKSKASASRKVLETKRRQWESKASASLEELKHTLYEEYRHVKSKAFSASLEKIETFNREVGSVWGAIQNRRNRGKVTIDRQNGVSEADYLEERLLFKDSLTNKFGGTLLVTFGMFVGCMVRAAVVFQPRQQTTRKNSLLHLQWIWGLGIANCFNFLSILLLLRSFNNHGRGYSLTTPAVTATRNYQYLDQASPHPHPTTTSAVQRQDVVIQLLEEYQEVRLGTVIHTIVGVCIYCGFDILQWFFFFRNSNNNAAGKTTATRTITIGTISIPTIPAVLCGCLVVTAWMMVAMDRDDGPRTILSQIYTEQQLAEAEEQEMRGTTHNPQQHHRATKPVKEQSYKAHLWDFLLSTLMRAGWAVLVFHFTCPTTTITTTTTP